jgi:hypothetical protein
VIWTNYISYVGKYEDVRSCTYPIDCELQFMGFASELLCENDILSQLLLEVFNNEQPLERLLE